MDGAFVRLTPKTRKGKNRIAEAKTDIWRIKAHNTNVRFTTTKGTWILIEPTQRGDAIKQDMWRWIDMSHDDDFSVALVDPNSLPIGIN
jgi:hypothetical protein